MRALLAGLVLALAFSGVSAASAARPAAGGTPTTLVIKVKSQVTASYTDDHAPKGESTGDRYLVRDTLSNAARQFGRRAGVIVGHDSGIIVRTGAKAGTIKGVATIPGGTIRFQGTISLTSVPGPPLKVTGGTGKYAQATGTLVIGSGGFPLNTYKLVLPV